MKVLVETSARHIHVTKEALETLFGTGHELTIKKNLSQPGEYACEERLDVVGPKNTIKGITILGPCRTATQVELSLTDARTVGIAAPVRESGDTAGTPGCKLVGPAGELDLKEGVIAAKRHIH
ncbi:MAG TPA: PduL/EutD family phosphate acyltransferase, partial [Oscillospiraceae bacterium]|nr:PduL/EutD family phosphate acyltransferase [Oscillospiraceae bacterium]